MKINFKYILTAMAVIALSVSCDNKAEFQSEKFVTMDHYSYSVAETVGEVVLPVHIYNQDCKDVQVSVKAVDGTAVAGTDYEILTPSSGVLSFAEGTDSLTVKVAIKPQVGKYTGNLNFYIQVNSATEGVVNGNLTTAMVTIRDLDHPLAAFLGDWTSTGPLVTAAGSLPSKTFTIVADDEDITKVWVENLDVMFAELNGLVAPDYNRVSGQVNDEKTKITIEAFSEVGLGYWIAGMTTVAFENTKTADIELVLNPDGSLSIPKGWFTGSGNSLNFYVNGGLTFTK